MTATKSSAAAPWWRCPLNPVRSIKSRIASPSSCPTLAQKRPPEADQSRKQPLVHDLAALRQPDALHDLVVVGQRRRPGLRIPEGGEEVEQIARKQRGGVRGEPTRDVAVADD